MKRLLLILFSTMSINAYSQYVDYNSMIQQMFMQQAIDNANMTKQITDMFNSAFKQMEENATAVSWFLPSSRTDVYSAMVIISYGANYNKLKIQYSDNIADEDGYITYHRIDLNNCKNQYGCIQLPSIFKPDYILKVSYDINGEYKILCKERIPCKGTVAYTNFCNGMNNNLPGYNIPNTNSMYSTGRSRVQIQADINHTQKLMDDAIRNQSNNSSVTAVGYNSIIQGYKQRLYELQIEYARAKQ